MLPTVLGAIIGLNLLAIPALAVPAIAVQPQSTTGNSTSMTSTVTTPGSPRVSSPTSSPNAASPNGLTKVIPTTLPGTQTVEVVEPSPMVSSSSAAVNEGRASGGNKAPTAMVTGTAGRPATTPLPSQTIGGEYWSEASTIIPDLGRAEAIVAIVNVDIDFSPLVVQALTELENRMFKNFKADNVVQIARSDLPAIQEALWYQVKTSLKVEIKIRITFADVQEFCSTYVRVLNSRKLMWKDFRENIHHGEVPCGRIGHYQRAHNSVCVSGKGCSDCNTDLQSYIATATMRGFDRPAPSARSANPSPAKPSP